MTDKITLTQLSSLENETTAINQINGNSVTIVAGFDNTLSRDGTSPNQMGASLDMNSFQILNLPSPGTINSPARLADVTTNPTITVPPTGTSGATVPFLNGNNTWSGTNAFSGTATLTAPVLGTPASATLTNATGLPVSTGVSGLGTGVATFLATPSSANLASAVTNETGSGALVFANSPTLTGTVTLPTCNSTSDTFLLSAATTGTPGHSLPTMVLRNNDTTTPSGAGGFIRFEGHNSSGTALEAVQLNGGFISATAGNEQGDFDISVYVNGAIHTVAVSGSTIGGNAFVGPDLGGIFDLGQVAEPFVNLYLGGYAITGGTTIAALPTPSAALKGARMFVTNGQTSPTFMGTVSTTGAVVAPVFCNGSAWLYG